MAMPPFRIDHSYGSDGVYQLSIEAYPPYGIKGLTQCVVSHVATKCIGIVSLVECVDFLHRHHLGHHHWS